MAITYEVVNPSPIENATVRKVFNNGVQGSYYINANEGYVLHDKVLDDVELDDEGNETGNIILGYSEGTKSCGANYDWAENPREFYAEEVIEDEGV